MNKTFWELHKIWIFVLASEPFFKFMSRNVWWSIWIIFFFEFISFAWNIKCDCLGNGTFINNCFWYFVFIAVNVSLCTEKCLQNSAVVWSFVFADFYEGWLSWCIRFIKIKHAHKAWTFVRYKCNIDIIIQMKIHHGQVLIESFLLEWFSNLTQIPDTILSISISISKTNTQESVCISHPLEPLWFTTFINFMANDWSTINSWVKDLDLFIITNNTQGWSIIIPLHGASFLLDWEFLDTLLLRDVPNHTFSIVTCSGHCECSGWMPFLV